MAFNPVIQDIQQSYASLTALGDQDALNRYLASTPYTASQIAEALPQYSVANLQAAIDAAKQQYPTLETWAPASGQQWGNYSRLDGGDPNTYNTLPTLSLNNYHMAQIGGYRGTYDEWASTYNQRQQQQYQQAQLEAASNPNVVVGGSAGTAADYLRAPTPAAMPSAPTTGGSIPTQGGGLTGASGGAVGGSSGSPAGQTPTGGASGGLFQGVDLNSYQQNPYLAQMGTVLTNRVTDNLNTNIMPAIRSNAVAAGGFGGSRQGVVEANALKDANRTISDALTGAYFQDFTNQMNRNLAQYGQNQSFYSNQRGQDLQQTQLGANLFNMGNQGWLSQGQGMLGLGQTQQQAPWQVINNANAGLGQWSGYGTTTSANQGGGAQGVLGGALAGGQLGSLWGGAGVSSPVSTPQPLNANYSLSTGGGLGLQAPSGWGV